MNNSQEEDKNKLGNFDERHRPTTLDDIFGQPNAIKMLKAWAKQGKIQHLLFIGPPGVGKTASAYALAHDMFGTTSRPEFNPFSIPDYSTLTDIKYIKEAAQTTLPYGGFKIIFLDDCDFLSPQAQGSLLGDFEKNTDKIKYIIACNHVGKIIDPLVGRCDKVYFKSIRNDSLATFVEYICEKEKIEWEPGVLELLAENAKGSMRDVVKFIGKYNSITKEKWILLEDVRNDGGIADPKDIKKLLMTAINNDVAGYENALDKLMYDSALDARRILNDSMEVVDKLEVDEKTKKYIIQQIGLYNWRVNQKVDEILQMRCFLSSISGLNTNNGEPKVSEPIVSKIIPTNIIKDSNARIESNEEWM